MAKKSRSRPVSEESTLDPVADTERPPATNSDSSKAVRAEQDTAQGPVVGSHSATAPLSPKKLIISVKNGSVSTRMKAVPARTENTKATVVTLVSLVDLSKVEPSTSSVSSDNDQISNSASKRAGLSNSQQRRINRPIKSKSVDVVDLTDGAEDEPRSSGYSSEREVTKEPKAPAVVPAVKAKQPSKGKKPAEIASKTTAIPPAAIGRVLKAPPKILPKSTGKTSVQTRLVVPVRRSSRNMEKEVAELKKKQEQELMIEMILNGQEDPRIEVVDFPEKGRGLIAKEPFQKGEFVVEYAGDLVDIPEARRREAEYAESSQIGCYMYYFRDRRGTRWCVDATAETGRYGRLLNHSLKDFNLLPHVLDISVRGRIKPHLILRAKKDIQAGEELVYDYGDRDRDSLANFPWLGN
ncbi:hypothetical protein RvY_10541 [Ramazzottius varieornatus]|uniref:[histone H4]-lysine(20) N-methyltransferase n=1 Tax=Ramazzottius varieornatus TaxID=947166 RepID=A0A1D1VFI5_RAMVA|nr:hypothetical protein RvY_10541 [Ramazzottius varieornatus]